MKVVKKRQVGRQQVGLGFGKTCGLDETYDLCSFLPFFFPTMEDSWLVSGLQVSVVLDLKSVGTLSSLFQIQNSSMRLKVGETFL